jgi:transposase InsO family protein
VHKSGFHPLSPIHASLPWDHVAIDLFCPGITSQDGYNYVLLLVDICSRFTILRPLRSKSAIDTAQALLSIFADFGFPKILQSDNGTEFVNAVLKSLTEQSAIEHRLITPYHPQANGSAERHVQIAKRALVKSIDGQVTTWAAHLPAVQMGMNCRILARHGSTPFSLCHGRGWNELKDYRGTVSQPTRPPDLVERYKAITQIVFPAINDRTSESNNRLKTRFDSHHIIKEAFPDGAMVMLINQHRSGSMAAKYVGPFKVLRKTRGGSYVL